MPPAARSIRRSSAREGAAQSGLPSSDDVKLDARPDSVFGFEDFVDGLDFLDPGTRMRAKLAGEEILDNIIRHAPPVDGRGIAIRATRRQGRTTLGFFFRSDSFAGFAARCQDFTPLFDPAHRRWRGIGLIMCRNLALRVVLRPGALVDRIFLVFDTEEEYRARRETLESLGEGEAQRSETSVLVD